MSEVTIKDIAKLREETGLGLMEVKKALVEAGGDHTKAMEILKKSGAMKAAKKAERASNNGLIEAYVHGEGKIGVIVEVSCETDFVAKNQEFKNLAHEIALQIAATNPLFVSSDQVPQKELDEERETILSELKDSGKPEEVVNKIVEGKLGKYFSEVCLLDQPYIKDPDVTIKQYLEQAIAKIGENITVKRFARFTVGC
jgi:elongation factor Ts